jgi:hypothetical protein
MLVYQVAMFSLENKSNEKIVMALDWVDHKFKDHPYPANMCTSELKPGKSFDCSYNYDGVLFICRADETFKQFRAFRGIQRIWCVWDGEIIQVQEGNSLNIPNR